MAAVPGERFRLDGKTALITGIGPGIGSSVARAYAQAGASVVLAARSLEKLEALAGEIRASGGTALAVAADVGRKEDIARLVTAARAEFGEIDVLFHNAAGHSVARRTTTLDATDEDWQLAVDVNLLAPFRLAQALVPSMRRRGGGALIHVLTTAAFRPIPPHGPYGATKAGLALLTRQLAKECAPEVRVNAICPGTIDAEGQVREAWRPILDSGAIAMARVGRADEVVGAALFLASSASSYVTGEVIFVDGGRTATVS